MYSARSAQYGASFLGRGCSIFVIAPVILSEQHPGSNSWKVVELTTAAIVQLVIKCEAALLLIGLAGALSDFFFLVLRGFGWQMLCTATAPHGCLLSLKSWKLSPTPRNFEMNVSPHGNTWTTDDLWNLLYNKGHEENKHINTLI